MYNQPLRKSFRQMIFIHLLAVVAVFACLFVLMPLQSAKAETRSLKLYYVHTQERQEIVYKKNGRYIASGLKQLNYFLRDWRRNEPTNMDPRLFDLIWQVYNLSGSHDYIHVISGYRSPKTNNMLRSRSANTGVAKNSQHTLGKAMDFYLPDVNLARLRKIGLKQQVGGVGYYPRSGSPFVHMDVGRVRHWPRMSRQELMALFPDGKSMYIPSDGKPLPRYEQAVAEYNARKGRPPSVMIAQDDSRKSGGLFASLFGKKQKDNTASRTIVIASRNSPKGSSPLPSVNANDRYGVTNGNNSLNWGDNTVAVSLPDKNAPVPSLSPLRDAPSIDEEDDNGVVPDNAEDAIAVAELSDIPVPEQKPSTIAEAILKADDAEVDAETTVAMNIPVPAERQMLPKLSHGNDDIAAEISRSNRLQTAYVNENRTTKPVNDEINTIIAKGRFIPLPEEDEDEDFNEEEDETTTASVPVEVKPEPKAREVVYVASLDKSQSVVASDKTSFVSARLHQRNTLPNTNNATVDSIKTKVAPKGNKPQANDELANVISMDEAKRASKKSSKKDEIAELPETVYASGLQKQQTNARVAKLSGKAINFPAVARVAETY